MMERSEQINELAAALSAAQGAIKPAPKDAVNPHLKSKYTTLDSVIETIKPALAGNGLAFSQLLASDEGKSTLTTVLFHSSGQWLSTTASFEVGEGHRGINALQAFGSALTYMKRYQLSALLGVSCGQDDDGYTGSKTKAAPAGPTGASRPLSPDKLREFLWKKCEGDDGKPVSEAQIPFVARKFAECFAPAKDAEERYHKSLNWLWQKTGLVVDIVDSAKLLTKRQAQATLDWLLDPAGPDSSGDTPLHEHAPDEAARIYKAALAEQGQQELL